MLRVHRLVGEQSASWANNRHPERSEGSQKLRADINTKADPDHALYGESIVLTGTLLSMTSGSPPEFVEGSVRHGYDCQDSLCEVRSLQEMVSLCER